MSERSGKQGKNDDVSRVVVLVIGAAFVIFGLSLLARQWFPNWVPPNITAWLNTLRGLGWGLGLILIGVLVIVFSQRKGFTPPPKGARLYRSRSDKMVSGVFGGLARYLSMDATLLRLGYAGFALLFSVWPALVAYLIATIIVPEEPEAAAQSAAAVPPSVPPAPPEAQPPVPPAPPEAQPPSPAVPEAASPPPAVPGESPDGAAGE